MDSDIRNAAAAIVSAALRLDSNADASAIQHHNPDIGNSTLRKFILKRNHSGFARKVIQLTLDLSNWQQGAFSGGLLRRAPGQQSESPGKQHHAKSSINRTKVKTRTATCDASSHAYDSPDPMDDLITSDDPATDPSQYAMPAAPNDPSLPHFPDTCPSGPEGSTLLASSLELSQPPGHESGTKEAFSEVQDALHDAQQLLAAGEQMMRESCGEEWLLQPLIPDMGSNEYR